MNSDDFSTLLGGDVAPLQIAKRVELVKTSVDAKTFIERREAASLLLASPADPLAGEPLEKVDPMALLSFQRPGVQNGVFRNLRLGKYTIDARLDLHTLTVDAARKLVYQFIQDCIANNVRTALITHGKGEGRAQPALLKSCVAYWLPQMDEVLAFHTAQKQHGSYGATYVLLKKSEDTKRRNREQHQSR